MARSRSRRRLRILSSAAVISTVIGALVAATPAAAASTAVLQSTAPSWVAEATSTGRAAPTARVQARVYLAPQGGLAAVATLATSISTPGSAQYRQFLSAQQYAARYAPTAASVAAVRDYLSSHGLRVGDTGAQNSYVAFTGTVAAAQQAFGVSINTYKHDGATVRGTGWGPEHPRLARLRGAHRRRARHLRALRDDVGRAGRSAAGRLPQRAAVLDLLRPDRGEVPGRLRDAAAAVQRQDAGLRALRLHAARTCARPTRATPRLTAPA